MAKSDSRLRTPIDVFLGQDSDPRLEQKWKVHIQKCDPCAFCGQPRGGTKDHIKPRSKGGSSRSANLAGACPRCNGSKSDKELLHYLLWKAERR